MQTETGTQTEVVLHSDRGGFARGPRWFCTQPEVDLHANRGGFARRSRWFWICMHPEAVRLYRSEADFGNCAKKGTLSPVLKYIEFILKSLSFSQGLPDPASVFAFRHPDRKVLTESFGYTERYSCSYFKVSEFHLAAVVEVCYCI
jgi:hypothetical protein